MSEVQFLFPSSALNPAQGDEHFQWQADLVDSYALVDLDSLSTGFGRVFRRLADSGRIVYRGWMLTQSDYTQLQQALEGRGLTMVTDVEHYTMAHHLPGWISAFAGLTPATVTLDPDNYDNSGDRVLPVLGEGPYIVKDYVKSAKHDWDTACFAPDADSLSGVVKAFVEIQGDFLAGGVLVRQFENFVGPETRVWWVDGEVAVSTAHPDHPETDVIDTDLRRVRDAVRSLDCRFVTTDVVYDAKGNLRVVEVGDGQVSDFPQTGDFSALAHRLSAC